MPSEPSNPFASPQESQASTGVRVSPVLRLLSIGSFVSGFGLFMVYYGYAGLVNGPLWIFWISPLLAIVTSLLGVAAIIAPWQPSEHSRWSWPMYLLVIAMTVACFLVPAMLEPIENLVGFVPPPRVILFFVAATGAWLSANSTHGTTRGRRLAAIGYGLGTQHCMTAVIDAWYVTWGF
ncbi:hypothetical protein AB1L30_05185 [Bremerella sp. JC817]|uniref:hypothetical protein n=1 Tax=Bremerella sp. JC817 TaxID=3231756 RepID=UPI003459E669